MNPNLPSARLQVASTPPALDWTGWVALTFARVSILAGGLLFVLASSLRVQAVEGAVLEFLQPTNHAVFSTLDEIPIMLRSFAPGDVIPTGEVYSGQQKIGALSYCCYLCPCFAPQPGQELILQIPVSWERSAPVRPWMGWTNVHAGSYRLSARAVSQGGSVVEATPISITVLDLTLRIAVNSEGAVTLVIPQGSLVDGGYEAEASQDLSHWTRLGSFQPGNVAAFFYDAPDPARPWRFYRSVATNHP
jgi:hypothetical protein